jgi:uncharacterized small protein (DUF1192 family)
MEAGLKLGLVDSRTTLNSDPAAVKMPRLMEAGMDLDDLEPRKAKHQLRNLDPLSVEELENYIAEMKAEILRVEEKIAAKKAHLSAASGLFKNA